MPGQWPAGKDVRNSSHSLDNNSETRNILTQFLTVTNSGLFVIKTTFPNSTDKAGGPSVVSANAIKFECVQ